MMEALELSVFIETNDVEFNYFSHDEIYMFVRNMDIEDFYVLLSPTIFDDGGLKCWMKDGYFAFEMSNICDYYGIDAEKIFNPTDTKEKG